MPFTSRQLLKALLSKQLHKLSYGDIDIFDMLKFNNKYCCTVMNLLIKLFDHATIQIDVLNDYRIFLTFDFSNKILILINNINIDKHEIECSVVFYIDTTQINNDEFKISKYININIVTSNFICHNDFITLNFFDHLILFRLHNAQKKLSGLGCDSSSKNQFPKLHAQSTCLH